MMKIEVGDVFKRRNQTMRVICTDMENDGDHPIVCLDRSDVTRYEVLAIRNRIEIETEGWIKVTPWDDFAIDEPVMVKDEGMFTWKKKHFAGISEDGHPMAWDGGETSFTKSTTPGEWDECRRPIKEEMTSDWPTS